MATDPAPDPFDVDPHHEYIQKAPCDSMSAFRRILVHLREVMLMRLISISIVSRRKDLRRVFFLP